MGMSRSRQQHQAHLKFKNDKFDFDNMLGHRKAFDPSIGEYVSRYYFIIKTTCRSKAIDVRENEMLNRQPEFSGPLAPWERI